MADTERPQSYETTPQQPPKPPRSGFSRRQILEATRHCLHQCGYDGTTIRGIARELNCAIGTIYRFFPDKRTLLAATIEERFEPVAREAAQPDNFTNSAKAYVQIARDDLHAYQLMFWLASSHQPQGAALPRIVQQILDGWSQQLADHLKARERWARLHGGIILGCDIQQMLPGSAGP